MVEPAAVPQLATLRAPRVRPLVHATGHPHARRPLAHPRSCTAPAPAVAPAVQGGPAHAVPAPARALSEPRRPRHPRAACAPAHGGGHSELAARFAHRLVEVLTGRRPAGQLQRHTTVPGYQQLTALVRSGPLRPRGRVVGHRLGRVYDSAPGPGALEVCVRVEFGHRHHMVAFRLEQHRRTDQWQCAAVEAR
ncbi:Rv3235 family protein [Saccharothrix sp. ST-888]|uniref:Rv3235 family protein n=1 Tax=Saccharothrix sp. ST-888 TaxID=1427391 RepID=UPI0006977FC6|nr:Rv3235 family protein [Saccharothrix sp. ST-888]